MARMAFVRSLFRKIRDVYKFLKQASSLFYSPLASRG
jgi:hypothetical protein